MSEIFQQVPSLFPCGIVWCTQKIEVSCLNLTIRVNGALGLVSDSFLACTPDWCGGLSFNDLHEPYLYPIINIVMFTCIFASSIVAHL